MMKYALSNIVGFQGPPEAHNIWPNTVSNGIVDQYREVDLLKGFGDAFD